jgi:hypothetical protein
MNRYALLAATCAAFCSIVCIAQTTNSYKSVEFTYRDGRQITYELDESRFLTRHKLELRDLTMPDTAGIVSMRMDSSFFVVMQRPNDLYYNFIILKRRMEGRIELFSDPFASSVDHFYVRKNGVFHELKKYRKYVNLSEFISVNEFQSVLRYLFLDWPKSPNGDIDKLPLDFKPIAALILRYNRYFDPSATGHSALKKEEKIYLDFHFAAGYGTRAFPMAHPRLPGYPRPSTKVRFNHPFANISIFFNHGKFERFHLVYDLSVSKISEKSANNQALPGDKTFRTSVVYDFIEIKNALSIRYEVVREPSYGLHLGIGSTVSTLVASESYFSSQVVYNTVEGREQREDLPDPKDSPMNPFAIVAFRFNAMELRYIYTHKVHYYEQLEEATGHHCLGVAINLSKAFRKNK